MSGLTTGSPFRIMNAWSVRLCADGRFVNLDGDAGMARKAIEGFPGYEVTDDGEVWSCWGRGQQRGKAGNPWRILKFRIKKRVYHGVVLYRDKASFPREVHRLVLEAFVGPCPQGMECCHNNGIPGDNRLENLRWDTRKANHGDQKRMGTRIAGSRHPAAILNEENVKEIRKRRSDGERPCDLAREFRVSPKTICSVVKLNTWRHVG